MNDGLEALRGAEFDEEIPASVDEAALRRLKAVAFLLDESVRVPGTGIRVGIDPLVSLVPVVGDVVSGGLSLYIVAEAAYLGVPYTTLVRMLANVAVDVAGGSLPYVGVVFDAVWKANERNLELLVEELTSEQAGPGADPSAGSESAGVTVEVTEPSE